MSEIWSGGKYTGSKGVRDLEASVMEGVNEIGCRNGGWTPMSEFVAKTTTKWWQYFTGKTCHHL